jgi:nucleoside-diphosphate-sugar epimerase
MKVFVAGGTGAVGSRLVPQLVAAGHEVTATARSAGKLAAIEAQGAKGAAMDGLDRESVLAAVATAAPEAIVHEMTGLAGKADLRRFDRWFATTSRLRTEGTDSLLEAAKRNGVGRLLAQGYTGWPNERAGGAVKDEDDPLDPDPPPAMRESLRANTYQERTWVEAGGLVLRYGSLYGPGTSEAQFVELARKRQLPVVGDGGGVWSFVHVDDAAAATVLALERGAPGVYNVVDDDPAPSAEWIPALAERCGAKPPRHLPKWLARPVIGTAGVSMMCEVRGSSNAKAKRELGWQPAHPTWRGVLGSVA